VQNTSQSSDKDLLALRMEAGVATPLTCKFAPKFLTAAKS